MPNYIIKYAFKQISVDRVSANYHPENSHVIPALIRKFHLAKLAGYGDREGILRDEQIHGPIPEDLKKELLVSCPLPLAPCSCILNLEP